MTLFLFFPAIKPSPLVGNGSVPARVRCVCDPRGRVCRSRRIALYDRFQTMCYSRVSPHSTFSVRSPAALLAVVVPGRTHRSSTTTCPSCHSRTQSANSAGAKPPPGLRCGQKPGHQPGRQFDPGSCGRPVRHSMKSGVPGITRNPALMARSYLMIFVTRPAPTVRPPSRMANRRPSSMAIG